MTNRFKEQIAERRLNDLHALEDAFGGIVNVINGGGAASPNGTEQIERAVGEILTFYDAKKPDRAVDAVTAEEYLDAVCRPQGITHRVIRLEHGWYRDAAGAILATRRADGKAVALLPGVAGYHYTDPDTGRHVRMNRKTEADLDADAICFYKPFPLQKLTPVGLVAFAFKNCDKRELAMIPVMMAVATAVGLLVPRLTKFMYGALTVKEDVMLLVSTMIFWLCLNIGQMLIGTAKELLNERLINRMHLQVESATMMRVLSLPVNFFRKYSSGELSQRTGYVNTLCEQIINSVLDTGLTSIFSLVYINSIFLYAPALVVPALVITLITALFNLNTGRVQQLVSKYKMEAGAQASGLAYGMIEGVQKIRVTGAENRAFAKWGKIRKQVLQLTYDTPGILRRNTVYSLIISCAGMIVMYYMAAANHVSVEDYGAFNAAYGMVSSAFMSMTGVIRTVAEMRPMLDMTRPILETMPEVAENKPVVRELTGAVEMTSLSFRYNDSMPDVLSNLSLTVEPGQYVAIVGKTGCGKSTLIRLLLGFEKPQKGAVYYDGRDLSTMDLQSLRRLIGVVLQDGKLFQGSIFENISLNAPWMTLDDAWEAAEMAGIADDIRKMPMGMQTLLSEGNGGVSGGQRQRLMIARAIAPRPKILIFDEATSALDNVTQKQVSEALDTLDCTRIVVAHRLSTIRRCDRIIYIENGRIAEDGTYEELIAKNGRFASLVERQRLDLEETGNGSARDADASEADNE